MSFPYKRIVILGGNGQLGRDLSQVLSPYSPLSLTHEDLEITDYIQVRKTLESIQPDLVINCVAYNKVDDAEKEFFLPFAVNALAVRNLSIVCETLKATLMHISTDYVFGGEKREPYTEEDLPFPLSVYGNSKLSGENFVRSHLSRYYIVRTSGLYGKGGSRAKKGNFVETMVRLSKEKKEIRVVKDQILTPTYTYDLAKSLKDLLTTEKFGLYHITNEGSCSWYEFAKKIFEILSINLDLIPISSEEYGAPAKRPSYSVLSCAKLYSTGITPLPPWEDALERYLIEKGYKEKNPVY